MKQRRVGTLTLGLTLILIGIIIPLSLIFKGNALAILQFAPVVLIALGVEILFYSFKYKEEKFKYDGLSIFMVIMITFVTVTTSLVVPVAKNAYENVKLTSEVSQTVQDKVEDIILKQGLDGDVNVYYNGHNYGGEFFCDVNKNIKINCQISIESEEENLDAIKSTQTIYNIANEIAKQNIAVKDVDITLNSKKDSCEISLRDSQLVDLNLKFIEGKVEILNR